MSNDIQVTVGTINSREDLDALLQQLKGDPDAELPNAEDIAENFLDTLPPPLKEILGVVANLTGKDVSETTTNIVQADMDEMLSEDCGCEDTCQLEDQDETGFPITIINSDDEEEVVYVEAKVAKAFNNMQDALMKMRSAFQELVDAER